MTEEHPNIAVLARFNPENVAETMDVFAEDVIWHYYNSQLPELHGDYVGRNGVINFFEKLKQVSGSDFEVNLVSVDPVGEELIVAHRKQVMNLEGQKVESDVVVVWRIVDEQIAEVWDIPSIHDVPS